MLKSLVQILRFLLYKLHCSPILHWGPKEPNQAQENGLLRARLIFDPVAAAHRAERDFFFKSLK